MGSSEIILPDWRAIDGPCVSFHHGPEGSGAAGGERGVGHCQSDPGGSRRDAHHYEPGGRTLVLVPAQLTSPSSVAAPRGTPCDVPGNVRLGRPRGQRLAVLVSWPGTVRI